MSRMKSHWPERLNPTLELRSAIQWLEQDLRCGRCDIYRCLAICEAVNILQDFIDALNRESDLRSEKAREHYRTHPNIEWSKNLFLEK